MAGIVVVFDFDKTIVDCDSDNFVVDDFGATRRSTSSSDLCHGTLPWCDLRIVSDANLFFIETILKHHGLDGYFSEINTNPGYVDEEGMLRIFPYHDFTTSSHGCRLRPPKMCKGKIIDRLIRTSAFAEGKKGFSYLGDGKGDYCPSLKLNEGDYVMPRKNYPLWDLICNDPQALKAEIHELME